jgi:hypothetical protein
MKLRFSLHRASLLPVRVPAHVRLPVAVDERPGAWIGRAANAPHMEARDLRTSPPRRWSVALSDIYWLPRLIDKTRAALAGTLGDYLFGQSPIDRSLLRELGLSHREFATIVRRAGDDDGAVLSELTSRDPGSLERARAWSKGLPERYGLFLWFIDVDDGYRGTWLRTPVVVAATAVSRAAKRLWPSHAAERAAAAASDK